MGAAGAERTAADQLPEKDVVGLLLKQHARIRELFAEVRTSQGESRKKSFNVLRSLLAVHEVAEELVLRPVSKETAGKEEADARNAEEAEAAKALKRLERMDVTSTEFETAIGEFEGTVLQHAEREERLEFPTVVAKCGQEQRLTMGERLLKAEQLAPTHPHPTSAGKPALLKLTGPFASMMDKVRDTMSR